MTPALRRYFKDQLMGGIAAIGPDFQAFCQPLVEQIVSIAMQHPGVNRLGHPVGHAVDSVSKNAEIIAEYSTDGDYFSGSLEKLRKDWKHARAMHPTVKKILFFSSRVCGPKMATRLTNLQGHAKARLGIEFEIYDANRISDYIVDNVLLNDALVEQLSCQLGPLGKIRDEYVVTHLVPEPVADYIARSSFEESLQKRLDTDKVVALAGLSGLGKSQTAANLARKSSSNFDIVVWLYSSQLRSIDELASFEIERRGRRVNALSLLKERDCLLVLDDLQIDISLSKLKSACGPNSSVLITRQVAYESDVKIDPLSKKDAKVLLESELPTPCPGPVFEKVWRTIGGHPLALRLMNAGVRNGGWDDVEEDCRAVGEYPDEDRTRRLVDRLLGRLKAPLEKELTLFKWCGTSRIDRAFARSVLAPVGIRKLNEYCLLTPDRADILRLHDIVHSALNVSSLPVESLSSEFAGYLEKHIKDIAFIENTKDLKFINLCQVHRSKLEELARGPQRRDAYLYCLLQAWQPSEVDLALIGSPEDRALAISESPNSVSDIEVYTAIEILEATYRGIKHSAGKAEATRKLQELLSCFDILEQARNISEEARSGIFHHHAKMLRLLDRGTEAIQLCEKVLNGPHPFWAAKLLLARLTANKAETAERAKAILFEIMSSAKSAPGSVEITVILAAIEEMGHSNMKQWHKEFLEQYGVIISENIIAATACGFDQSYSALAAIGRSWQWVDSQGFVNLLSSIPPLSPSDAKNDYQRASWGEILLHSSKAALTPNQQIIPLNHALAFYNAIQKIDHFHLQQKGQILFHLKQFDLAAETLKESIKLKPSAWNRYWLSKVLYAMDNIDEALKIMNDVCNTTKESDQFLSTFLDHRYEVRSKMGDARAIEDLERAHNVCKDSKYKNVLSKKLERANA